MDFQQPYGYSRAPPPPPPTMADPHYQLPPSQRPPVPPPNAWYSTQFQYRPPAQQSPPPPPASSAPPQWAQPPPPPAPYTDHLSSPYPPPPPPPYAGYPPPPPLPPRPPAHPPIPPSYSQHNQDWTNANRNHQQSWEHSAPNNEEDWAAKARAWAAAKAASENQQPLSQFPAVGRMEEQSQYFGQYTQSVDHHFPDVKQPPVPTSNYQQYPSAAPMYRTAIGNGQESGSFSQAPYVPDGHALYATRDGTLAGDSSTVFPQQDTSSTSPSALRQEVPSSYSSIAGKANGGDHSDHFYKSPSVAIASAPQHHALPQLSAGGRSAILEEPHYSFPGQSTEPATDLSDKPLDFAPRFRQELERHSHSDYSHSQVVDPMRGIHPGADLPSVDYSWHPATASAVSYPSIPSVDPALAVPSPGSLHTAPVFGRLPGSAFQATVPSLGGTFGVAPGSTLHPPSVFSADTYGVSTVSERPKKASVPNWLREEIIKKKAVITSTGPEISKDDDQSAEYEHADKYSMKGEQADSRSFESSKSTEEEEDDEDEVEAARTAAINQEIKRLLTEVLLKVTDELFDEIATKVLDEDDPSADGYGVIAPKSDETSIAGTSLPAVQVPKASAKVLVPVKPKETDVGDVSERSTSSSAGDILGLGNYASDDEDENDTQNSNESLKENKLFSPANKALKKMNGVENGDSPGKTEEHVDYPLDKHSDPGRSPGNAAANYPSTRLSNDSSVRGSLRENVRGHSKMQPTEMNNGSNVSKLKDNLTEDSVIQAERFSENRKDRDDKYDSKKNVAGKELIEEGTFKEKAHERAEENNSRDDSKHVKREKMKEVTGSKDRQKEKGVRSGEKTTERAKESESRKRPSNSGDNEDRKDRNKDRRGDSKEGNGRKREKASDEKREKSRNKHVSDSSRHKRRRSSSTGSRGRDDKENSFVSHPIDSSDDASGEHRRKVHSRRHKSPSPVRSKRRQDSRSPHSKHSQRRHSPYSSFETTSRGRRSRSKSPVRRKR